MCCPSLLANICAAGLLFIVSCCFAACCHCCNLCGAKEGPLAFYKGWLPSVIGVVPYVGLNFGVYETLKHTMLVHYGLRDERELSVPARLGCGAVAGTLGQTVAYPFDVARRRLQVSCAAGWVKS
jgi:solute carrier family 25 phosphate transporter 23/24/25/41